MFYSMIYLLFFFFKQKTAYEMRISDWSSDVCSSDLAHQERLRRRVSGLHDMAGRRGQPDRIPQTVRHDRGHLETVPWAERREVTDLNRSLIAAARELTAQISTQLDAAMPATAVTLIPQDADVATGVPDGVAEAVENDKEKGMRRGL